ncbi:MAG: RNA polymerase factor sigma-54 [Deltaproteobacteria bacterium]|nr:RNA polymerase factor sigma-54 [Deltaproteobacteria bacterium]
MALELRQHLKLAQQLVMTPQLQQAIKLLQLSRLELQQAVREELEVNPALEDSSDGAPEEETTSPEASAPAAPAEEAPPAEDKGLIDRVDWEYYFGDGARGERRVERDTEEEDGRPYYENTLTRRLSLSDHLETQIRLFGLPDSEQEAAFYLIGNIDENGYLKTTVEEAAEALSLPVEEVSRALGRVHTLDPLGVGARDLRECLLIQAREGGDGFELPLRILEEHFELFSKGDVAGIARRLKVPKEAVKDAFQKLVSLWPKPGRAYSGDDVQYITPDVTVFKMDDRWIIQLNEDGQPRLRLSSYYRSLLSGGGQELPKEDREFLKQKVNSALWFIKSIEQRKRTIYKVVESIIKLQGDFFEKGPKHLRPLTLKDVAEDIEMHESTVSRVTSGKYVNTPHGIFELKYFFNSGLNRGGGEEDIASKSVKEKIREIIRAEGENKPLSDQELMRLLQNQGIRIARRTVTKYRAQLGLLSSSGRRRQF